jgi:hypothetical protein
MLSKADIDAIVLLVASNCDYPPFVDEQKFKEHLAKEIESVGKLIYNKKDNFIPLDGAFFGLRGIMRHILPEPCTITITKKKGEWVFHYHDEGDTVVRARIGK